MKYSAEVYSNIYDFWNHWGFKKWEWQGLEGVWRQVEFRKGALLGTVARYYAQDFIVWNHAGLRSKDDLFKCRTWEKDLMTQRFLLLGDAYDAKPWVRSFYGGFRGFIEVLRYIPGEKGHRKFRDLTGLVNAVEGYVSQA